MVHDRPAKQTIYLIVGVPGAGKSWIARQIKDKFTYVHHDGFIGHINQPKIYVNEIIKAAAVSTKPILAEAPFSISMILEPLQLAGLDVQPKVILEDPALLTRRYQNDPNRDGKAIPKGHITRMNTYAERAKKFGWFAGTSQEVLDHLRSV